MTPADDNPADDAGSDDAPSWPGWPTFSEEEIMCVSAVLRSGRVNYWTGEEGRSFEAELAAAFDAEHAIALSNGTAALEAALVGVELAPGDEVIVPARTFIATAAAVVNRGGVPIVADVDQDSGNISAATIAACLSPATRGIVVVHLGGWPCEMTPILELAKRHDLFVIEDCAQSIGATYRDRWTGTLGDVGAFSFCQDKILTTGGEGGMVLTADGAIFERMWAFKDHGKSYDAVFRRQHPEGFRWLHESFGTNLRLTEMQAAMGRVALARLPDDLRRRRANAARLLTALEPVAGLRVPMPPAHVEHAYYKASVYVRPERLRSGWNRDRIQAGIEARGVPVRQGPCSEIYRERAFAAAGLGPAEPLPIAQRLGETTLMFLVHPTLGEAHMEEAATVVADVMGDATR